MSSKNRKLQVFVSSTFTDLREERQAAVEAILSTGNIPAGMELFAAGDQSQMEIIKEWIQESDVYLLILGGRYGSIEPESGKSYTQLEYEYALSIGKPHFAVVTSEKALNKKVKKHDLEMTERSSTEKYNEFKKLVTGAKLVEFWDDIKGIELAIHKSLSRFSKREELIGWVRGDQAVDSGLLAEELARLGKENSDLRVEIQNLKSSIGSDDFHGLSFQKMMMILNTSEYQVLEIKRDIIQAGWDKYFDQTMLTGDTINANNLLLLCHSRINGVSDSSPRRFGGFFNFLNENGLTKFVKSPHEQGYTSSEFTDIGRRYFNRLRSIMKTIDISNDENQIR